MSLGPKCWPFLRRSARAPTISRKGNRCDWMHFRPLNRPSDPLPCPSFPWLFCFFSKENLKFTKDFPSLPNPNTQITKEILCLNFTKEIQKPRKGRTGLGVGGVYAYGYMGGVRSPCGAISSPYSGTSSPWRASFNSVSVGRRLGAVNCQGSGVSLTGSETKIQPKEEVFGRVSLRASSQKLRSGPLILKKIMLVRTYGHAAQMSTKELRPDICSLNRGPQLALNLCWTWFAPSTR